jgi:hypothetical protein
MTTILRARLERALDRLAQVIEEIGSLKAQHRVAMREGDDDGCFALEQKIERAEIAASNIEFEIGEIKQQIADGAVR